MKRYIAIAFLLAGCATEPAKPSVILPAGTKIILKQPTDVREAFMYQVDYGMAEALCFLMSHCY